MSGVPLGVKAAHQSLQLHTAVAAHRAERARVAALAAARRARERKVDLRKLAPTERQARRVARAVERVTALTGQTPRLGAPPDWLVQALLEGKFYVKGST